MKHHNVASRSDPKDRLIDYHGFAMSLRKPCTGRRLQCVNDIWKHVGGADSVKAAQLREHFTLGDDVWGRVAAFFGFDANDAAAEVKYVDWLEAHADISSVVFSDAEFVANGEKCWGYAEAGHLSVHDKDTEALVSAIRLNLMKMGTEKHTEDFVLREIFR